MYNLALALYKEIPKPHYVYAQYFRLNGKTVYSILEKPEKVARFTSIYEFRLLIDERLNEMKRFKGSIYWTTILKINASKPNFKPYPHNLRESFIKQYHKAFAMNHVAQYQRVFDFLQGANAPPKTPLRAFIKKQKEPDLVENVLDVSSLLLGLVGFDAIPETIGLVYAHIKDDDQAKLKYLIGLGTSSVGGVLLKKISGKDIAIFLTRNPQVWVRFVADKSSSVVLKKVQISKLQDITWNQSDEALDLIIHAEGNVYKALLENKTKGVTEVLLNEKSLAKLIESVAKSPNQPVRLLSCSNLQPAHKLSKHLDRPVIATDGVVHLHGDGGITTVGSQQWYKLEAGNKVEVSAPRQPDARYKDDFVRMGLGSQTRLQNLVQKIRNTFPNTKVGYFENELAKVPNIEYILNDANTVARIMTLDNTIAKYSLGSGSGAVLFTERQAFLYDLQSTIKKDKYGGSLRKLVEGKQTDLPTDLIKNWQIMSNAPTLRRRSDYLLCSPKELAEKLNVNYKKKNLETIQKLAPGCKNCYNFYNDNQQIRGNIWNDAVQMYTRLGKGNSKTDWGQFFSSYEAHHILPKDLLVPDKKNPRAINGFIKYMEHYQGKVIDFNSLENGIMLEKYSTRLGLNGVHASHNEYTRYIRNFFDNRYTSHLTKLKQQNPTLTGKPLEEKIAAKMHQDANSLVSDLKKLLETKSINGGVKVNDLVNDIGFQNLLK